MEALLFAALVWHGSLDIASARAELGPWQMNESRWDFVDDPTVALDERGGAAVAWVDQASRDVFFRKYAADGKPASARVNVSRTPKVFSWLPRLAIDPKGRIFVLWQEIVFSGGGKHGGDILVARSEDDGATFSAPLNLSNSAAGDGKGRISQDRWDNGSLDLAIGPDGTVYAAWSEYEGALWVSRSSDGGKTFSKPLRIADTKPARAPALAVSKDQVWLAWTVGDDDTADIRVARSTDRGASFGKPAIVEKSPGYSDAPKIGVDPRGVLHVVWTENMSNGHHVRYSRSTDGATFERARDISGKAAAAFPSLGIDGAGRLYVLWERYPDHPQFSRGLGLAVSGDGGKTFNAGEVPRSMDAANGGTQGMLMRKLAVGRDGSIAVVNSSFLQNQRSRVWLMRANAPRPKAP